MSEIKGDICANCRYMMQGEAGCYCAHPNQRDKDLKKYTYWPFSCSLFVAREPGDTLESVAGSLGLKRKTYRGTYYNGEKYEFNYWTK